MVWLAGMVIGLYLALTGMRTDPWWALFSMFFAGANFGCLFEAYTMKPKGPPNSTQSGWANKKRRDS